MKDFIDSCLFAFSGNAIELPGLWERVEDDFAGCLILVEQGDQGLRGRLTYVPALMRHYGWKVSDIKWKQIVPAGRVAFRIEDLFKELDPKTNAVREASYRPAKLTFVSSDEFVTKTRASGGRNTRWRRVTKAPQSERKESSHVSSI